MAGAQPTATERRRNLWAQLIRGVHEVDPLLCHERGGTIRVLAFVLEPGAIRKIVAHRERTGATFTVTVRARENRR